MLGFATVDHQSDSDTAAVWLTNRTSTAANHGNAVTIDLAGDPDALRKVHSLSRDRFVLLTDGSTTDGLPLSSNPVITMSILEDFVSETVDLQGSIGMEPQPPVPGPREPAEDTATQRAFEAANYLARVWSEWLRTDNERRKRSGKRARVSEELPPVFIGYFSPEPIEVFSA